jgi:hypothetical protein
MLGKHHILYIIGLLCIVFIIVHAMNDLRENNELTFLQISAKEDHTPAIVSTMLQEYYREKLPIVLYGYDYIPAITWEEYTAHVQDIPITFINDNWRTEQSYLMDYIADIENTGEMLPNYIGPAPDGVTAIKPWGGIRYFARTAIYKGRTILKKQNSIYGWIGFSSGSGTIALVPPVSVGRLYTMNIKGVGDVSPVDVWNIDAESYPNSRNLQKIEIKYVPGMAVYVPRGWYWQMRSEETVAIVHHIGWDTLSSSIAGFVGDLVKVPKMAAHKQMNVA